MTCEQHKVFAEKLRVGEKRMNKHSEKLDKIMERSNQILLSIVIVALTVIPTFIGTVWIASGRQDPAIERIEKLIVEQQQKIIEKVIAEQQNKQNVMAGLPDDTIFYDIMREDNE